MASSHRVTDLEKIPVRISKDEAPMPLSVVGPLFISSLLFYLSRALLRAWACYATEGALFISAQRLSTDAVSAFRKVRVLTCVFFVLYT